MTAAISCRAVSVEADGRSLLREVSLDVDENDWVCVLGPNGAGKTTLVRALMGVQALGAGRVTVLGRPLTTTGTREWARLVAVVPQMPVVPAGMQVLDYVLLGRTPHRGLLSAARGIDLDAAYEAIEGLGLGELAGRAVGSLSGGELQRVVVARALTQEAPVLLLDEPTSSLDMGHQLDVLELVDDVRRARRLTVLSTMHDLTLAAQFARRILLLRDGAIVQDGTVDEVMTPETLGRHYGARVAVVTGPHGRAVVPYRRSSRTRDAAKASAEPGWPPGSRPEDRGRTTP
jgi:iron complex transport system ATP-binding protein